jgi:hypothetical protein
MNSDDSARNLLPDVTLPELTDVSLPDNIFDDLPWNDPEPETGDSTARGIVEGMSLEEREKMIGVSPAIRAWFERLLLLPGAECDTTVRRMASVDREKFNRWRGMAA